MPACSVITTCSWREAYHIWLRKNNARKNGIRFDMFVKSCLSNISWVCYGTVKNLMLSTMDIASTCICSWLECTGCPKIKVDFWEFNTPMPWICFVYIKILLFANIRGNRVEQKTWKVPIWVSNSACGHFGLHMYLDAQLCMVTPPSRVRATLIVPHGLIIISEF